MVSYNENEQTSQEKYNLNVKQLTEDHKPYNTNERERIIKKGGILA